MVARSAGAAVVERHEQREMIAAGFWRRRATVPHDAEWVVIAFATDGSSLEGCRHTGCIVTRKRRPDLSLVG
jgi:hypothetical protein